MSSDIGQRLFGKTALPKGTLTLAAERLDPTPNPYLNDPAGWAKAKLGAHLWSKQVEVGQSVVDNRYTAVQSCHDVGKSFVAAVLTAWWLDVHPVGEAFVVTTAPTAPQVETILWREIGRAHRLGNLQGYITGGSVPAWKIGSEIVGYGRKPADYDQAAFQGIHARFVLVIVDEACGVPKSLFDAVDALVTNEYSRVLAIGNPDDPATHFEAVCRPGSGWHAIRISAFDSPNFTEEYVPDYLRDLLVSQTWVEERRRRWGEASPLYVAKVLGLFPEVTDDTLITPAMMRAAIERQLDGLDLGQMGGDVARLGTDRSVVYWNRDGVVRKVYEAARKNTMATAEGFAQVLAVNGNLHVPMNVDVIGIGAGVFDRLNEQNYPVQEFNGAAQAVEPNRFVNARAEAYWTLREAFENGLVDVDGADEDLQAQLVGIKFKYTGGGKIQIESKDEMRKRGMASPDHADACSMSFIAPRSTYLPTEDETQIDFTSDLLQRKM